MNDPEKVLHELQVYQIELELQNDELKRYSEELVKSHSRFTDLFEHAPVGYFLLKDNFTILNVNFSASIMLKLVKEVLIGKPITKLIHPDCQDKFYFLAQKVLETDELHTEEIKLAREGDGYFWVQLQCIRDFDAITAKNRIRLVMSDITERKNIEKKLKRFRAALDSTADNIFLIDYDSAYFIDVNDAASRNLGYSREEFMKMQPAHINPEYSMEFIKQVREDYLRETDNSTTMEMQYRRKNGTLIDVEVYLKTALIDDEKVIVAVARDITERKKSQNQLAQYARELEELNTSKDKFLSIISHDLRGPFLGLKGYTQMLIEEYDLLEKEEIIDYLNKIHDSSKDLYTLVDNLLKWSRLELGKIPFEPQSFNLNDELESLFKLLTGIASKKQIKLIRSIPPDLYPFADRLMLLSIMQNLVGNAIKFTRKNGTVKIDAINNNHFIHIKVEDNGVGMTSEVMEKLFTLDKSHTSRGTSGEKGTGFGLIIAREMIKKMGGTLSIESEPLKGSSFTFTLPKSSNIPES
ncbi:MAG: PAS domain-containing sensor histidine kinase [Bacteroidota bacterium]